MSSMSNNLIQAIKSGDEKQVIELTCKENAFDSTNSDGYKPIHLAIQYGHLHLVDWFLNNGVSLECGTVPHESTPLHIAAIHGQNQIIERLLDVYHDKLSKIRKTGDFPLYLASKHHIETVKLLL